MSQKVSDADIAEEGVRSLILEYFKEELSDTSLHMQSEVFPTPTNHKVVLYNQLAVRTCLLNNWPGIQKSYPCLHGFGSVVGDADFLYTSKYPYCDLRTLTLRVVETVHDFVHFTLTFIRSLCASEICFEANCVNTKRTVVHPSPASSTIMSELANNQWATPANQVKVDDRELWGRDTTTVSRARKFGDQVQTKTIQKFGVQQGKPEYILVDAAQNMLKKLQEHNEEPSKLEAKTFLINALNIDQDHIMFHLKEDANGDVQLISLIIRGKKYIPSQDQIEHFEKDMRTAVEAIVKNDDLQYHNSFLRMHMLLKNPLDWYVQGAFDEDNNWYVHFHIYVINEEMVVIRDIEEMKKLHEQKLDMRSDKLTLIFDDGLKFDKTFTSSGIPHATGEETTPETEADTLQKLTENKVHLGLHKKAAEDSLVLTEAFFGSGLDAIEKLDQKRAVMLFISEKKVDENPEIVPHMQRTFTEQSDTISHLREVQGEHDVEHYFGLADEHKEMGKHYNKIAEAYTQITGGDTCGLELQELTSVLTGPQREVRNLDTLDQQCRENVASYIAAFTPDKMDRKLDKDVAGWKEFVEYRDATTEAERAGKRPTKEDFDRTTWAKKAWNDVQDERAEENKVLGFLGSLMRKQFHEMINNDPARTFPITWPWNWPAAVKSYFTVVVEMPAGSHERKLLYNNFYSMLYERLIADVSGQKYLYYKNIAIDVMFMKDRQIPRSKRPYRMSPAEFDFYDKIKFFLLFYAATIAAVLVGKKWLPFSAEDPEGNMVDIPENIRNRFRVDLMHMAVITVMGVAGERMDLTIVHVVIFILLNAVYMGREGYNLSKELLEPRKKKNKSVPRKSKVHAEMARQRREAAELLQEQKREHRSGRGY